MPTLACSHQEPDQPRRVCLHLLARDRKWQERYYRRFTGVGLEYDLVCATCREHPEALESQLRLVCAECFQDMSTKLFGGFIGSPQVAERPTSLAFAHEIRSLSEPFPFRVLDIQPVDGFSASAWVALTEAGGLAWIDLDQGTVTWLARSPTDRVNLKRAVALHLSPDGEMAALVNTYGEHGVVIDLKTGKVTLHLERDTYHENISVFPLAFFVIDGRLLLAHGTAWNRLDISDPRTGKLLTSRISPPYVSGKQKAEHYLDYFHCGLSVSPSQEWIVDNGWVWHPVGEIVTWNLRRWLQENVWESEDGPSRKELCWRDYFWDGPLCWIDGQTLAVWGYGDDDAELIPAVRLFDVASGQELRWFPGPFGGSRGDWVPISEDGEQMEWRAEMLGRLAFDTYLFSFSQEYGTSVWDAQTGERLLFDAALRPLRYHRGAHQFLTILPDGAFQISRLVGQA